jgi:hypothetical protein
MWQHFEGSRMTSRIVWATVMDGGGDIGTGLQHKLYLQCLWGIGNGVTSYCFQKERHGQG